MPEISADSASVAGVQWGQERGWWRQLSGSERKSKEDIGANASCAIGPRYSLLPLLVLPLSYFLYSDALTSGALLTLEGVPSWRKLLPRESHSYANQWPWDHTLSHLLSHTQGLYPFAPVILRLSWPLDNPFPSGFTTAIQISQF